MKEKVYVLPGLMCDERLFVSLTPYIQNQFEIIFVAIPLAQTVKEMIEKLEKIFPLKPINLLGFSLGGYVASYFAVKHPQRIKRVFIMASSVCSMPQTEIQKRQEVIRFVEKNGLQKLSQKQILKLLDPINHQNDELKALIQNMYVDLGEKVFKQQIQSTLYREDLSEQLNALSIVLWFFYAQNDQMIDHSWFDLIKENERHKIFTHQSHSHMLPLEEPQKVVELIDLWLQSED
ncbi:alpha/beta fold hydrolase [Candidatus Marinarcus aquaticus]|uniref:AB hydrolase-1 domain-containing protein n=1 Tax=Candidatus Marinarcus aquaticus TaxID=2044504 RepID=A0A4Q0XVV6_9BACT|nr:alpha/beta hydrolase [Candidatus Marinarcus aquaticus]RXJ60794.1 hypothetical protein CRV04_01915 [Candidatus Marinarcus aquaticus]